MGSTPVVEQLSFSLLLSILTFDSDLILGSFFYFLGNNRPFLGVGERLKNGLGSTHVVEQLSFSTVPSILSFDLGGAK